MTDLTVRNTSTNPANVRAWARENGYEVGTRGRFDASIVRAYNAVHRGSQRYVPAGFKRDKVATLALSKSKTRRVAVAAARTLLREAGEPVGKRGRLSQEQLAKAVSLAKK